MKVGFIGLGRMGKGMASRVLSGGHDLAVYDVAPQATAEFAQSGARVASSVADVCKDREVVITMLAEDFAVHEVAFGPGGICASLPAGAIHMAMGTYGVATIRALETAHAKANQVLLAVPVLGRPDLARVPLPSGNAFRDRLLGAVAHGNGEKDWSVAAQEQARASGLE